MAERLNSFDVSFLYLEEPTTAMHVGGAAIFQVPEGGFDYEKFVELISERIAFVPRYRQRVRWVPGRLGNPVWVNDANFDVGFHVRRSALPRPGSDDQLRELVGRVQGRPLDRTHPLWEIYLVEGLRDGRFAVITKTHPAMVDGVAALDIGSVILDATAEPREARTDTWRPGPEPSWLELVAGAVADVARRPTAVVDTVRGGLGDARGVALRLGEAFGGVLAMARTAVRPAPASPLNVTIGEQRRFGTARTALDDYRQIRRAARGTDCTVNDVVLATVAGALRIWLLTRGESVTARTTVRALVPLSVRPDEDGADVPSLGNHVTGYLVDLPVGEPSPLVRLHRVSYAMRVHRASGQAVGADTISALSGFAPPTLHALGARAASGLSRRLFNIVVTNVPGPQTPLYARGALMLESYPVVPLVKGQALSIGLTSYNGKVHYGLNGDRDAMPDIEVLAHCLPDALNELLEAVR
ncbi:MAG: WS/DGAT/MGAT family O-acyltransferase [Streptomycetales bacterium]